MNWILDPQIRDAMVAHTDFSAPEEACGLLAGDRAGVHMVYCLTNRDRSTHRFTVDPNEHYRAWRHAERHGWDIVGSFHSHPRSAAIPSATDVARALDPTWIYVIVGLGSGGRADLRGYLIRNGEATEVDVGGGREPSRP
jgi:proteasome lid subunit RPN8/RPN11